MAEVRVFSLENLRQTTNFQSWKMVEFGRGGNFSWKNSEAVPPNRLIAVMLFCPTQWGKISSEKFFLGRSFGRTK